jgi:hypothetical protein
VWWIWTEREERLGSGGREKRMNERRIEEKGAKKEGPTIIVCTVELALGVRV